MIALATEDDQIAAGASDWNDIGYIQTKKQGADEDMSDDQNIGIGSLNKMKEKMVVSEEKQKRADEIAEEINEREGSDANK